MTKGHWVVRMPTWLGDTVMAIPTVRALSRAARSLVLWGPEHHARLLCATGVRAEVLPYTRRRGPAGVVDIARATRALAGLGATGVVLLPNAYEPALIAKMARVRRRVGFATQLRGNLLTTALPAPDPLLALHESRRYSELLAGTPAASPLPDDWRLAAPRRARERARGLLGTDAPVLAVVPGCANGPAKIWPAAHYARVIDHAARRWDAVPVILGGTQDADVAAQVADAATVTCINIAGKTDLVDLAAILSRSHAVIANDTGAAHLAAALSVPTLVLFGPTDPQRTRPLGPHVRVASVAAFCQPCLAAECMLDHRCMIGLTPDLAIGILESLWHAA